MAASERFQPLPAGTHGLDPQDVRGDQARRLREAMIELIAAKGYPAVRISDLSRTAHVSPPTLYSLYADKEQLFIATYEDVARRTGAAILAARDAHSDPAKRLGAGLAAFAELAVSAPRAISLLVQGAFGAGPTVLRKRRAVLEALEAYIQSNRAPGEQLAEGDLIVRAVLGGVREVTATRLRENRQGELPELAGPLVEWARCYPPRLPDGLAAPSGAEESRYGNAARPSARARLAEGPLPSGRSELPPEVVAKSQQERIVDATAAIVAEEGLTGLTIPAIARRANISNQTFYSLYRSKHEAFMGAQKVSLHQALRITATAYAAHPDDWPRAVAAGISALLGYLASEPAHARLTIVDTFAASPDAIRIRQQASTAFRSYLSPGLTRPGLPPGLPGELAAEGVVGGIWQILHDYVERGAATALPALAPQLTYFALTPFVGAEQAAAQGRAT